MVIAVTSAAFLASCAGPQPKGMSHKKRSKEYFAESEYGVKASPRVTTRMSNLQRGGGRDQTGKPYQVRGKWYYPKEDKNYAKVGGASWYGEAFHGRLTANGEVYDMTHLTAAHPTMPLPSYARVTNTTNGSSVIVRVNDRGPYSDGRIIDLSKRAAEMLDYAHTGTAKVKVEYVGRAPLEGADDQYLMASYRPGAGASDPLSDGLPQGVMIAMNGPTPSAGVGQPVPASPFPGTVTSSAHTLTAQAGMIGQPQAFANLVLPEFGPIAPERPHMGTISETQLVLASMSYADERIQGAAQAFAALEGTSLSNDDVVRSWKKRNASRGVALRPDAYVAAGSFEDGAAAKAVARALSAYGKTNIEKSRLEGKFWYSVSLLSDGRNSLDDMLEAAWAHGAPDAIAVQD